MFDRVISQYVQKIPRWSLYWALRLAGIAIFLFIIGRSDVPSIIESLRDMDITIAVLVLFIALATTSIRAYRWSILMQRDNLRVRFRHALTAHFIGVFLGFVTPGRVGEHAKAIFIDRYYPGLFKNFLSTLVDRYIELLVFLFVAVAVIWQFISASDVTAGYYFIGVGGGLLAMLALWPMLGPGLIVIKSVASKAGFHGAAEKLGLTRDFIKSIPRMTLSKSIALTFLYWVIQMSVFLLIARGLCIPLSPAQVFLSSMIAVFAVMIPVSIGGIGTREAALIYAFGLFGEAPEKAVSMGIVIFLYNVAFALMGLSVYLIEKPGWQEK